MKKSSPLKRPGQPRIKFSRAESSKDETIAIYAKIHGSTHKKLTKLAADNGVSLSNMVKIILYKEMNKEGG